MLQKYVKFCQIFDSILFFFQGGFGALWVCLGKLLGPLESLLGGLKSEKVSTVPRENHFFQCSFYNLLKFLMAFFGLSWSLLVYLVPNVGSQRFHKFGKHSSECWSKKRYKKGPLLGSKMGAKKSENRNRRLKAFSTRDSILSYIFFYIFCRFWSSLGSSWEPFWALDFLL